jgi:hypothetical protein
MLPSLPQRNLRVQSGLFGAIERVDVSFGSAGDLDEE